MKKLLYKTEINAKPEVIFHHLTDSEIYRKWAKAFSKNSMFHGKWAEGEFIKFIDPDMGGTLGLIRELNPNQSIFIEHVATLSADGTVDRSSEIALKWIGCKENYFLNEKGNLTELVVEIETDESFAQMFNDSWPAALDLLKSACEE